MAGTSVKFRLMVTPLCARLLRETTFGDAAVLRVACSGGPDSTALAILAAATLRPVELHHVDHGLREGSETEAGIVKSLAERLGASFVAHSVMVAPGPNLEARARSARRSVRPLDAATGHTMDDQAETVLLNLLRGAGLNGVGAMTPGPLHPILALRRSDTHALCAEFGAAIVQDASNEDPRFLRNRVRAEVLPLLAEISERDPVPLLARTSELARRDAAFLDALSETTIPDPTDVTALRAAPDALVDRALRRWLRTSEAAGYGHPPSDAELSRVKAVVAGDVVATELSGGRRVARTQGVLRLELHGSGTVSS